MVEEKEQLVEEGSPLTGGKCVGCNERLEPGDAVVLCPRCKSPHHTQCWKANGGCARVGCFQTATAVVDTEPRQRLEDQIPRHKWKWWEITLISLAGLALLLFGVLGIGRDRTDPALAGKTLVRFMMSDNSAMREVLDEAVIEYETEHPDVKILVETVVPMGYEQKLVVLIAAGDPPDIFGLPPDRFGMYVERQAFADVGPYLFKTGPELGLTQEEWAAGQSSGATYGFASPWRQELFGVWNTSSHQSEAAGFLELYISKLAAQRPAEKLPAPGSTPALW